MTFRTLAVPTLAAGAALTILAAPAWADCQQEIEALDQAAVAAETGATSDAPLPATQHQKDVLSDEKTPSDEPPMETGAGATGDTDPTSMHQRQVMAGLDDQTRSEAAALLAEAEKLAQAGREQACLEKVAQVRELVGTN